MPNWCYGTASITGTKEALVHFVLNGLHCTMGEESRPIGGSLEEDGIYLHVINNQDADMMWVEGTHRNFATPLSLPIDVSEVWENNYRIHLNWDGAWNIDSAPIADICAKYKITFLIEADEPGMGFRRRIKINESGDILIDEDLGLDPEYYDESLTEE